MANSPQIGTVVGGRYKLLRLLGEGGMGAVYEAENTFTSKRVAIKWMHASQDAEAELSERLMREAQAAARVRHPNVVDVYDVGREGDAMFLVMELLDGEPLSALFARGGLPLHKLIALLLPAMRGVAAAHKAGVIHRDLKPDNIFLAREGDAELPVPKLVDFGISKLEPRGGAQLSLTKTGSTIGTPMYMSYEQLTGVKDLDARTDVYAFGVILYEALTGKAPFEAATFPELAIKIATTDPVSPKLLRPDLPTSLEKLIQWAMQRDRDQRIPTMDALIMELEPFASEHSFRAQMTIPGDSLPMAPPAARDPVEGHASPMSVDSIGRISAPIGKTIPYLRGTQDKRPPWLMGGLAACVGAAIAAWLVLPSASPELLPPNLPSPSAPAATHQAEAVPEVSPQPVPTLAPLAPLPADAGPAASAQVAPLSTVESHVTPPAAPANGGEKKMRNKPISAAKGANATMATAPAPKLEGRTPTPEAISPLQPPQASQADKMFRAPRPDRSQF